MFFRDLIRKPDAAYKIALAEIRLPVRLGHRDAQKAFGLPLSRQLAAAGLGDVTDVRVHGVAPDEIRGVTLFVGLRDPSRRGIEAVARMLETLHAPFGSSIRLSDGGQPHVFGVAEGLELSVENERAPNSEARRLLAQTCSAAMKGFAINRGWARRDGRTIFYFYGESYHRMQECIQGLIERDPALTSATARRLA